MEFKQFKNLLSNNFEELTKESSHLFEVDVDKDDMWNLYLDSFKPEYNQIFRERREHDCSCCRQFIKNIGNAVVIKDNEVKTIWDFETGSDEYQPVIDAMKKYIESKVVTEVYFSPTQNVGIDKNFEQTENGKVYEWNHLYLQLPNKFVNKTGRTMGDIKGDFRDVRNVFKRSLDEITEDSVLTVLELINSNTLYKGAEWKNQLTEFAKHKRAYSKLNVQEKELYVWEQSVKVGAVIGKIRNHSIGTLLVNISESMELDLAVKKYEQIVAPSNYKRPKAIFTKKMLEDAQKTIESLGYMDSLKRRYAKVDDITVNNILFANRDTMKKIENKSVFDEMISDVKSSPKKFSKVEEVAVDKFIKDILPSAKEVEIMFENKHSQNMVSLIAPEIKDSKTMFKWDNNFSWAYTGNVTDSLMAERVKSAGGKIDGDLRFSIQWNDRDTYDNVDLDAHAHEPNGTHIYFGNYRNHKTRSGGTLDVDIMHCTRNQVPVENITWDSVDKMQDGEYVFKVHNYSRGSIAKSGFRAEIAFNGETHEFDYSKPTSCGEYIEVARVTLKNGVFTIKSSLSSSVSSKEVWGVKTNDFVPVSAICYSPNYWNEQKGIGHQHLFFMIKNCVNPEIPNGFYNEFLKQELYEHKRVFEALGGKMRVEDTDNQLSGVGFSMTKRAEVIVKVKGSTERVIKVKF